MVRFEYWDHLLARASIEDLVSQRGMRNSLREHYLKLLAPVATRKHAKLDEPIPFLQGSKNDGELLIQKATLGIYTGNGGQDYIDECKANGVPVPTEILGPSWVNHGVMSYEFLGGDAELWTWTKATPTLNDPNRGICLALPRWNDVDETTVLGVICQGHESGKACFFDWQDPSTLSRSQTPYPMSAFAGGDDLKNGNQGECSICHAGENAFVVYPEEPAFVDLYSDSARRDMMNAVKWHEPIVPLFWALNPGPLQSLGPVSSVNGVTQQRCDSCHNATGQAGRFPEGVTQASWVLHQHSRHRGQWQCQ